MKIESTCLIKVRLSGERHIIMHPGRPIELNDHDAQKLLAKAPNDVREVRDEQQLWCSIPFGLLTVGRKVEWQSPLFGITTGVIALPPTDGKVLINPHEVTGEPCFVPLWWLTRIVETKGMDESVPSDSSHSSHSSHPGEGKCEEV